MLGLCRRCEAIWNVSALEIFENRRKRARELQHFALSISPQFFRSTLCVHSKYKNQCMRQCLLILERVDTTFYCQERHKFSFSIKWCNFSIHNRVPRRTCALYEVLIIKSDFPNYWPSIKKREVSRFLISACVFCLEVIN